jgi:hypothetical protein
VLESRNVTVGELRQARSKPLADAEARALLSSVDEVVVAKGKKVRVVAAAQATPDDLKGPTGGYRAPILRRGRRLLVGFQGDALAAFLGS